METIFEVLGAAVGIVALISLAIVVFTLICQWKMFVKMGEPGWKCLIPFYNSWTEKKHTWGHGAFMLVIPAISLIPAGKFSAALIFGVTVFAGYMRYRRFGKSTFVSILLGCFPFIGDAICAFDKSVFDHDERLNFMNLFSK